jgi:HlyD family secretion protein
MKTKYSFLSISLLIVSTTWMSCKKNVNLETIHPTYQELTESVFASGTITPKEMLIITAQQDGYIDEVYVNFEQDVKKGSKIVKINGTGSDFVGKYMQKYMAEYGALLQKSNMKIPTPSMPKLDDNYIFLKSSIAGRVNTLFKKKGDFIFAGEPIALISNGTKSIARLEISEEYVNFLKIGQEVVLSVKAMKSENIMGELVKIDPYVDSKDKKIKLIVAIKNMPKNNYIGLSVDADIIIRSKEKVLCIPIDYLQQGDSLMIQDANDKVSKIKVNIGTVSDNFFEINDKTINESTKIVKTQ